MTSRNLARRVDRLDGGQGHQTRLRALQTCLAAALDAANQASDAEFGEAYLVARRLCDEIERYFERTGRAIDATTQALFDQRCAMWVSTTVNTFTSEQLDELLAIASAER